MEESGSEQDKSEEASPFKLSRARKKGMIARGTDLGFVSILVALAISAQTAGSDLVMALAKGMRRAFVAQTAMASDHAWIAATAGEHSRAIATVLILPALVLLAVCVLVEVVQNRGVVFSAEPLKPDFTRLNPAKGLKRLFSSRMVKELFKNIVKFTVYSLAAVLFVVEVAIVSAYAVANGRDLADALIEISGQLLLMFIILAAGIAILDQLMARREFAKQMRMSQRDVKREVREREGEPRLKRKRKQLLEEILKQAAGAANVKGADVLIVNPTHYAVALRYRSDETDAPVVQARGRNLWAQRMRQSAEREGVIIIRNPALARALFRHGQVGRQIRQEEFVAVADIYIMLRRAMAGKNRT
jgi:flagellar biosynthesis protein FlhB